MVFSFTLRKDLFKTLLTLNLALAPALCFAAKAHSPELQEEKKEIEKAAEIDWLKKYDAALEKSRKEHKPILIYFTASDWSGWCMKLKKEVIDTPTFKKSVQDQFVCLEIDFPFYKNQTEEEIEHNTLLKEKFEISEYPRLVVVSEDERVLTKVGYLPGDGDKVASHLLKVVKQDRKLTEVVANLSNEEFLPERLESFYKRAKELQRDEDAEKILSYGLKCQKPLFFLFEKYRLLLESGRYNDPEAKALRETLLSNDRSNSKNIHFSLALIDFQELSNQLSIHQNPKLVIHPLEEYIDKYGSEDSENTWRVEMMIAQFYLDYDDNKKALSHAQTAFETAPENMKHDIQRSVDYIRKQIR